MIRVEYLCFLQTLNTNEDSKDVRKVANLVLQNLETLIPLSTSQGHRIKKTVSLAQENWHSINSDIQAIQEHNTKKICPIIQLKSLSVGPFRGFAKQEIFDLSSQLVLIYGPNGTGKTSFCEALEYGLLGKVTEAESNRFSTQDAYFKNAHTKSFTPPMLIGLDSNRKAISISANEALYRFSFVEKNRIDNFSRIAAQVPSRQTELISTLFGLDAFTDFVRDFTEIMDGKYIDLEGIKAKELEQKKKALIGYQQQLQTTIPDDIRAIESEELLLANKYREGWTIAQMVAELNGSDEKKGLIENLQDELQKPITTKSNLTTTQLETLKKSIEANVREQDTKRAEQSKLSQQISFKQLYEAISQLKESGREHCPACQTPLAQATVNPFVHAEVELKTLQHLSHLEEALKKIKTEIEVSLSKLSEIIKACCLHITEKNPLSMEKVATIDYWNSPHQKLDNGITLWEHLEAQVKQLEDDDQKIDKATIERDKKQAELKRLGEFAKTVLKLQTRRETANNSKKKAEDEIKKFNTENAKLIIDVEAEKAIVTQNQVIANAYAAFVQALNIYKNSLPEQLVADLGETVVQLYNAFNRNDAEHEKLAKIILPLFPNQRLQISFKKNPDEYFDALCILSEGHIRCVGLAILTAKNIKENCPLLIFDDPVNAIDEEHRESIRKTLFEDPFFNDKQIILACHGEEFFKDIQNLLSTEKARKCKQVSFLPKNGGIDIRVNLNCSSRNYILTAREHYDRNEIRDALGKSRQALEFLTIEKVWSYLNKHGGSSLSIQMSSVKSPIGLRNLTEQLSSKIDQATFQDTNKANVLDPMKLLLGINGDSMEWRYSPRKTNS